MPSSTPFSSAWRIDTDIRPSPWPICLLLGALVVAGAAIFISGLQGFARVLLILVLLLCALRTWHHRRPVVHLRATPAVLRLTFHDQVIEHALPPWRTLVLPWMVAVALPGRFGFRRWVHFYRGQLSEEDWRRLRVILRLAV